MVNSHRPPFSFLLSLRILGSVVNSHRPPSSFDRPETVPSIFVKIFFVDSNRSTACLCSCLLTGVPWLIPLFRPSCDSRVDLRSLARSSVFDLSINLVNPSANPLGSPRTPVDLPSRSLFLIDLPSTLLLPLNKPLSDRDSAAILRTPCTGYRHRSSSSDDTIAIRLSLDCCCAG